MFNTRDELLKMVFSDVFKTETEYVNIPRDEVIEDDDKFTISIELPGFHKSDINIDIESDVITISAERVAPSDDRKAITTRKYGKFKKKYIIKEMIDNDLIDACLDHGILTLQLPKVEKIKPRRVTIK